MSPIQLINLLSVITLLGFGLLMFFMPKRSAELIHFELPSSRGFVEFRAIGGTFIGLALAPLLSGTPTAYHILGASWLATGIARIIGWVLDRPKVDSTLPALLAGDLIFGIAGLLM
jgi:hypothetical protein